MCVEGSRRGSLPSEQRKLTALYELHIGKTVSEKDRSVDR